MATGTSSQRLDGKYIRCIKSQKNLDGTVGVLAFLP